MKVVTTFCLLTKVATPPRAPSCAPAATSIEKARSIAFSLEWPREESNLDQELRSLLFYPLNYGAVGAAGLEPATYPV